VVDDRHSERFWVGARDVHPRAQLGPLLQIGTHAAGLGQMTVVVLRRDLEMENWAAKSNAKSSS
jgi:hypothetical protein